MCHYELIYIHKPLAGVIVQNPTTTFQHNYNVIELQLQVN